ncbi:peptide deformylase [Vannielia litorea]|uniref:peptide deformylase n=1 Tax=Vannielia litorea TaxID=1217970 RepID=UPI001C98B170|nr:peptide deformylase [Vannielia litorea]MBY6048658.1 peptide deformylase [Vannielia litorea]MBY6076072.1 peptide deformylase [Vannielia litorea]
MSPRPFIPWPDKRLQTAAAPVGEITDEIRAIWDDMVDTMEAMPGYGLAAPQIGVMLRLAVVDCSKSRGQVVRLADPEITMLGEQSFSWEEASPNLPGASAKITRPSRVAVAYTDETGERVEKKFEDLWATSVQHQIDHLNGRMFFDNLSRMKRQMLLKKAAKKG